MKKDANKKSILMYMHAGSGNHGCEAIVRSLCGILGQDGDQADITLLSNHVEEDTKYGLDEICRPVPTRPAERLFLTKAYFYALKRILGNGKAQMAYTYKNAGKMRDYDVAVSIGGDNYCYDYALFALKSANEMFVSKGVKTLLVGCSIEPELLEREDIVQDMARYSGIVARESITYNALTKALGGKTQVFLAPDPAFAMKPRKCELPDGFEPGNTIAINVSPMILEYEREDAPGITLNNYCNLIEYILKNTNYKIALIPHVVTPLSDDMKTLQKLYDELRELGYSQDVYEKRMILIDDHPAEELKYIISQCRLLIAARTHATIAAYSTCIPTLVIGYSVKSVGIATDLFGTTDGYVLPVQELREDNDIVKAYIRLENEADGQREHLESIIPEYIARTSLIKDVIYEQS